MSAGTLGSRILGLLRDIVLAAYFSRTITDAFVVAFSFPNKFRRLLGEGSLSASFIPIYVDSRENSPEQAAQLKNGIFTLLLTISSALCVLGVIFMKEIMELLVGGQGYVGVEGKMETTILFARIMFSYLFLITSYAFGMAILNAHKQFFIPAIAPAIFNLVFILVALAPSLPYSPLPYTMDGTSLAWGVIFGGFAQAFIVFISLHKQDLLPRIVWAWKSDKVVLVLKNMIPGVLGMGILQFLTLVNTNYASRLSEGSHSYIYWADRILELPQSLIAISLGAALLPTLSQLQAQGRSKEMITIGQEHILTLLFLTLPSAVGMFILAQPIVEVLYLRGQFTLKDAAITAMVVRVYSFLLVALSITKVLIPNFYAIKNTWIPALTSVVSVIIHIFLGFYMVKEFGLMGLVLSMTFSGFINLVLTLLCYRKYIGPLLYMRLMGGVFRFLPSLLVMGLTASLTYRTLISWSLFGMEALDRAISLGVSIGLSIVVYFLFSKWTGVPQASRVLRRFRLAE